MHLTNNFFSGSVTLSQFLHVLDEQVDYAPGVDGEKSAKRIVDVHELADLLTLATSTKASGNESFAEHDFTMAITRYVQVNNFLKDICAARDEENSMIDDVVFKANRNLTLAALKNWEWGRAKRACDTVSVTSSLFRNSIVFVQSSQRCVVFASGS